MLGSHQQPHTPTHLILTAPCLTSQDTRLGREMFPQSTDRRGYADLSLGPSDFRPGSLWEYMGQQRVSKDMGSSPVYAARNKDSTVPCDVYTITEAGRCELGAHTSVRSPSRHMPEYFANCTMNTGTPDKAKWTLELSLEMRP